MMDTISLTLAASIANAQSDETAHVIYDVAYCDDMNQWRCSSGHPIYPFWTKTIVLAEPAVPEGWIDYLRSQTARPNQAPKIDLDVLFGPAPRIDGPKPRR